MRDAAGDRTIEDATPGLMGFIGSRALIGYPLACDIAILHAMRRLIGIELANARRATDFGGAVSIPSASAEGIRKSGGR